MNRPLILLLPWLVISCGTEKDTEKPIDTQPPEDTTPPEETGCGLC